jgi:hypothetical protein
VARSSPPKELVVPPDVHGDPEAAEVLRAWLAHGDLHCSLKPTIWEDAGHWGLLLADVARHVAHALEQKGQDPEEVLERIRDAFDTAMDDLSEAPDGGFQGTE